MRTKFLLAILLFALLLSFVFSVPAAAASRSRQSPAPDWRQYDTATYVVSTLNVLHSKSGHPILPLWQQRLGHLHYSVYSDTARDGLFFIEVQRTDGTVVYVFAYELGWSMPQEIVSRSHYSASNENLRKAYTSDSKVLAGTFTSSMPR